MKQKPRGKGSLHLSRATTKARPAVHADHLEGGPRLLWDEPKIFFLERRYFFSIILSEFLKNRVALQRISDVAIIWIVVDKEKNAAFTVVMGRLVIKGDAVPAAILSKGAW